MDPVSQDSTALFPGRHCDRTTIVLCGHWHISDKRSLRDRYGSSQPSVLGSDKELCGGVGPKLCDYGVTVFVLHHQRAFVIRFRHRAGAVPTCWVAAAQEQVVELHVSDRGGRGGIGPGRTTLLARARGVLSR